MNTAPDRFFDKKFWFEENLRYSNPHFRLFKCANIIKALSRSKGRTCDLLDVGCGPATLVTLLPENIHYYGIDLAIHESAPNLKETDILKKPIEFEGKKFDFVVASGIFEYIGTQQHQKFLDIKTILKEGGHFIATFVNIDHRHPLHAFNMYNNIIPIHEFLSDLRTVFHVDRYFPTSYNWHGSEPRKKYILALNLHMNLNIPVIGPWLAVEYIFICSAK